MGFCQGVPDKFLTHVENVGLGYVAFINGHLESLVFVIVPRLEQPPMLGWTLVFCWYSISNFDLWHSKIL